MNWKKPNLAALLIVLFIGPLWAFDSSITVVLSDGSVSGSVTVRDLPEFELEQALRDGFRSELSVILRLVKRNLGAFPWIDQIVEEQRVITTIWYDRHLRHYFVQGSGGQVIALKTYESLIRLLSQHSYRFSRYLGNRANEFYIFYRVELRPIRLSEPFQIFLFYPFFNTFVTPWRSAVIEAPSG